MRLWGFFAHPFYRVENAVVTQSRVFRRTAVARGSISEHAGLWGFAGEVISLWPDECSEMTVLIGIFISSSSFLSHHIFEYQGILG